jgi:hypothetical protein
MANPNWVKGGESPNPKGRPPKAREAALLAIAYEVVNAQAWRQICAKRVMDALGKKQVGTGADVKLIDDEKSTAQGRNLAATFLRDVCIGKPTEYVNIGGDDSAYEQFAAYTDEQIAEILATIERIQRDGGGGGDTTQ